MMKNHDLNGYKKIIKSARCRKGILDALRFVPDSIMLKVQYRIKTGRKLDLKAPERFTEKLQWYKCNYRNPLMRRCVDKYQVRGYIKEKGFEDILVPLIERYDSAEQISLHKLPDRFVMKTTNGGGGLNVVVCQDKTTLDINELKEKLHCETIKNNSGGREWAYYGLKPGIVAEQMLVNEENPEAGVNDYKIFCYNGKPRFIVVDADRYIGHKRNFYDVNWNNLYITSDCPGADREFDKPENFSRMLQIASELSADFPFVRVDLYNCSGKIYFGELTFYPWSGYVQFEPDDADYLFGKEFQLMSY